eukprot:TRINITY_DN33193_c0_g1_i1.p1 TRINITY_DN33193_c0_g1~~TRINITY_DN33193_c0_g1_i1.p1  ORF type:complete len:544 (-),score=42.02 TRINITY_DN33193_c0_g1_i1:162-1793(-)
MSPTTMETSVDDGEERVGKTTHERTTLVQPPTLDAAGEAAAYIAECHRYSCAVDPTVVIGLQFGSDSIHISSNVPFEGCLLPLYPILVRSTVVRALSLEVVSVKRARGVGNSNAKILGQILSHNHLIEFLDLRSAGIDALGMADLCSGLMRNNGLRTLNLKGNYLGPEGGRLLYDVIVERGSGENPWTLQDIDISFNSLGFKSCKILGCLAGHSAVDVRLPETAVLTVWKKTSAQFPLHGARKVGIRLHGNFVTEETWNAVTHGIGTATSIIGAVLLLREVSGNPAHHIWGCVLFCMATFLMFLSSTLYHSLFIFESATRWFQILDHVAIYVMISASYSPFFLFYPEHAHLQLLRALWWVCAVGIVLHVLSQYHAWGTSRFYLTFELILYIAMGLCVIVVWDTISVSLPAYSCNLLIAGGILYLSGVPFFILGDYYPICHCVWHIFVMTAVVCHWFSVLDAARDALKNHSAGPFDDDIQWYYQHIAELRRVVADTAHDAASLAGSPLESVFRNLQKLLAARPAGHIVTNLTTVTGLPVTSTEL